MSTATLNRQDFARLVQDRLIAAGEDRPLEYDAAGFTLIPRGTHGRGEAVPLAPFHQMYLANPKDLDFVVKQFVEFWKGAQKQAGAAVSGPTFVSPGPAAKFSPPVAGGYPPRPRSSGVGTVLAVLIGGFVLVALCVFVAPLILVLSVLHGHKPPGPPPMVNIGPMPPPMAFPVGPWPDMPGSLPPDASTTEMVGGSGGGEQQLLDPQGRPLVGVACAIDEHWDGDRPVIGTLLPIFDRAAPPEDRGRPMTAEVARDGYVVGGLVVDASQYVNAVKVIYVKQNGEAIASADTYESEWLGTPRGDTQTRLAGDGRLVLGLHAKQGLVLDAVGLIVRPAPQAGPPAAEDAVVAPVNPFEQAAEVTPP
jgi:hypothetical protein